MNNYWTCKSELTRIVTKQGWLLLVLLTPACTKTETVDNPLWAWHEHATELYSPSFSKGGDELTLVRKRHIPDGGEAEALSETELKKPFKEIDKNERYADPEVIVVKIGAKVVSRIDWGWSPAFSPNGRQIIYAYQKNPISRFRVLAKTMAGNGIRIFDRDSNSITTLAVPTSGYLSEPIFAPDGKHVVYSLSDAINGAWGGNIGIGRVTIKGTNNEILYPALKEFGLFHLVGPKQFIGPRLVALRSKPTSSGTYIADSYLYELIDLGPPTKVMYSWATHKNFERPQAFGSNEDGKLLVYDHGWQQPDSKIGGNSPSVSGDEPGILSPDGLVIAVITPTGLDLQDIKTRRSLKTIKVSGKIQTVVWSPDSQRLAVVSTKYNDWDPDIFSYDEIAVFGL